MPETNRRFIDGISQTRKYRIVPRIIKYVPPIRIPQLDIPLPPRVRLFKPMLIATLLVVCLTAGWSTLTVLANRDLNLDGSNPVDITNIPFPDEAELTGPIPLTTGEPDVKVVADTFLKLLGQYREDHPLTDDVAQRAELLRIYLAEKKSPLADDPQALEALAMAHNTRMILGIMFVEGNFCRHQVAFNCVGYGGSSKFKHYTSFKNGIVDLDRLLERRYQGLDPEGMNCEYVQPCNGRWVNGIYQVLTELKAHGIT